MSTSLLLSATTLLVPMACEASQPETFITDDGDHVVY
jgi:hypothetical protein